jgi:PAS domain-containing protein
LDRAKGSRMVQLLQASHTLSGCQGDLSAVRGGHSAATAAVALAWFFVSATLAVTLAQRKRSRNRVRSRWPAITHQAPDAVHPCLAAAISLAADGIVITDAHGTIEYVNPAFTRMTGYHAEAVIGHNPRLLKPSVTYLFLAT